MDIDTLKHFVTKYREFTKSQLTVIDSLKYFTNFVDSGQKMVSVHIKTSLDYFVLLLTLTIQLGQNFHVLLVKIRQCTLK